MKLAVVGAGAVGRAVVELATEYDHSVVAFSDSTGAVIDENGIDVDSVLDRVRSDEPVGDEDPAAVLDTSYDVLVEAATTTLDNAETSYSNVRTALERDRHVVLANRVLMAQRYADVRELADKSEGSVRFGATMGGALPIISIIEDFRRSHITAIFGAFDGTANFILSRMAVEGLDYEHVLAEAQDLGVATSDPSFEVDGIDAALKSVIVANALWEETGYAFDDAEVTGIGDLSGSMLELAREDGRTIRLIAEITGGTVRVGPRLIDENSPLAPTGTTIAVQLDTTHAGRLNLSGRGTGGVETASMVMSDVDRITR